MNNEDNNDLEFEYTLDKNDVVTIKHHGKFAVVLRGKHSAEFLKKMTRSNFAQQQQWMARVTGNYKRGNERQAKNHPKNR